MGTGLFSQEAFFTLPGAAAGVFFKDAGNKKEKVGMIFFVFTFFLDCGKIGKKFRKVDFHRYGKENQLHKDEREKEKGGIF